MGHNSWRTEVERIESIQRADLDRALKSDAVALVDEWNRRLARDADPQFSPSIGAAVRAGKPFLRLLCPGCLQHGDVDLRRVVRPRSYPITGIYDAPHCKRCRGETMPKLIGLFGSPDDVMGELRARAASAGLQNS